MFNSLKKLSLKQYAIALTLISVVIRFLSLGLYPLMDTTEARYGEMARIMYETGNWITPMFDYNVPFWGKPPLFTWLSAAGFELFGVNEFAARIPHLFVGLLIIALTWIIASKEEKSIKEQAWLAAAVLATTSAFIVISGAVMTDTALTFGMTLSMVGFWLSWTKQSRFWGYMFFVGLSIGMLAKGPLTLILVGISLTIWLLCEKRWKSIPACLPWKGGIAVFLILTLPWYLLAEWKSPGFLNYFIIGEHIKRFIVSGWQGDLYGTAHKEIRGTIWLYWALAALPWTPVLFYQVTRFFKAGEEGVVRSNGYFSFLWCWMLSPLILFTFSGNILSSYVMPGLPAFALLVAGYQGQLKLPEKVYKAGLITPLLIIIAGFLLHFNLTGKEAEKNLLAEWSQQIEASASRLIYVNGRPFSAQFYSSGRAKTMTGSLPELLNDLKEPAFLAAAKEQQALSIVQDDSRCELRAESRKRQLFYCAAAKI
ncbi:ArnT family glycosyltransferase [Psychromonas aquimarina]|uniref:ArnT family glycosyltransferase n=1 Tax=Psychromonas aquimarina TaxID=444919 RepID=UPI0003FC6771|nr:glycosyltransferase family 39 protein [Psychromonas aquimarina]